MLYLIICFAAAVIFYYFKIRKQSVPTLPPGAAAFSEMPGPTSLPLIGTLYLYWNKKYSLDRLHWNGLAKFKEFGWIVREEIVPGVNLVWIFHPKDIRLMYGAEGRCPSRRSHTALGYYRKCRPEKYSTEGLLPTNGEEWRRIRKALEKPIATATATSNFIPKLSCIAEDFLRYIENNLESINSEDFLPHLNKVFLEMTGEVTLDERFDSLRHPLPPDSVSARLMKAAEDTNSQILETDNGLPLWKLYQTKPFSIIKESQEYIEKIAQHCIREKKEKGEDEELTLLDRWLKSPGLTSKDVMTGVAEFLLAGVHTSSFTFSFLLYHLANNPQAQTRLRTECADLKQSSDKVDRSLIAKAVYAAACLKESLRLNPVSVGVGRILPQDTVIGGFLVPKGTVAVSQNQVISRFSEFFPSPNSFTPERWIQGEAMYKKVDPFISQPFGYGPRQCIGKNLAEGGMLVLLVELVCRLRWEWEGPADLDVISNLINKPDKPIRLRFSIVDS